MNNHSNKLNPNNINNEIDSLINETEEISINDDNLNKKYEKEKTKKWIKIINLENLINFNDYKQKDYFEKVATVLLDDDKKRNTLIKFEPIISKKKYNEKIEWLYIFLINNKIVKIGGTRTGLKGRLSSYLCGHHIKENGKSGDCSKTNAYIYNTFYFYLKNGYKIDMYGYKLPIDKKIINILDKKIEIICQTYHSYESIFLEDYKKNYNKYPVLSFNSDPNYK
jgi:hypothetical protein